jgi:hypothetical protein
MAGCDISPRMVLRPGIQDFKAASLIPVSALSRSRLFRLIFGGRRGKRALKTMTQW